MRPVYFVTYVPVAHREESCQSGRGEPKENIGLVSVNIK